MVGKAVILEELRERVRAIDSNSGRGDIQELVSIDSESVAMGFMAPMLARAVCSEKPVVWVSEKHKLYPPGLADFGLSPEHILFVQVASHQEALWVLEKTLETAPVAMVVGENLRVSLTTARRLQLAAGKSNNRLFLLYTEFVPAACHIAMARWQVSPLSSSLVPGLFSKHGVGHARFRVELVRYRGGVAPQVWDVEWDEQKMGFNLVPEPAQQQAGRAVPESEAIYARYGFG